MTTEMFSIEQFEDALDSIFGGDYIWHKVGYVGGELQYMAFTKDMDEHHNEHSGNVTPRPDVWITINSSIDSTGYAQSTGENSIRAWITDVDGNPLGNKIQKWVTRQPGWIGRLNKVIAELFTMADSIQYCPTCGKIEKVFIVKNNGANHGRFFKKCDTGCNFQWLDEVDNQAPPCPNCGQPLVERDGKYGSFWGCPRYPDCKGTMSDAKYKEWLAGSEDVTTQDGRDARQLRLIQEEHLSGMPRIIGAAMDLATASTIDLNELARTDSYKKSAKPKGFQPSKYQTAIFDWMKNAKPGQNLFIQAGAGTGKTTTGVEMLSYAPTGATVAFLAFNRGIASAMGAKLRKKGIRALATTFHSLAYSAVREAYPHLTNDQINTGKLKKLYKTSYDWQETKDYWPAVSKLVGLSKATLCDLSDDDLAYLAMHYDVHLNGDAELIFQMVREMMAASLNNLDTIDFDDMLWLPVVQGLPTKQYDLIVVDEAQDTNACQIALLEMHRHIGTNIVAVGDPFQAIYGFRGADAQAVPNMIKAFNMEVLPLSITYRCPKVVVQWVNEMFPEIPFEAPEWADYGKLMEHARPADLYQTAEYGDMVLCRTNAPLVKPCLEFIRMERKATIVGKDMSSYLTSLIEKMGDGVVDIPELIERLQAYLAIEYHNLMEADNKHQAEALSDNVQTLLALSDGQQYVYQLVDRINDIFRDGDKTEGIVFSTAHRAKGLEAQKIFIIRPGLFPHPMAEQPWEIEQERNLHYVAGTRSLQELWFVYGFEK